MNEREHRQRMIVESWDGDDPLDAFAVERATTPTEPALPVPAIADDDLAIEYDEVLITRPARRSSAAIMGVAGLVVVAAATVAVLSMFVRGNQSPGRVTSIATRSDSDPPAQIGSAGQLAERDVVPKAIDLSPQPQEPSTQEPIQKSPTVRTAPDAVETAPPRLAEPRLPTSTAARPAPTSIAPAATTGRPVVVNTAPPAGGAPASTASAVTPAPSVATASPPLPTASAAPTTAVLPPPNSAIAPPPSAVTPPLPNPVSAAPAGNVATAPPGNVVSAPASIAASPPSGATTVAPGSATAQSAVTAVLQRYAAAFSALDVRAAKAVWPHVNQDSLTRAFSALQEQKFDLGNCDIWVTGASAVASCAGRATYTPKVGNRKQRSEAREWTFYLDQDDQRWSIATVKIR